MNRVAELETKFLKPVQQRLKCIFLLSKYTTVTGSAFIKTLYNTMYLK